MARRRGRVAVVAVIGLLAAMLASPAQASHGFGDFETDGNRVDSPAGGPADWATPAVVALTQVFDDATDGTDDSFVGGSKELEPGVWECSSAHSVPDKSDIDEGGVLFRQFGNVQYLSGYWQRDTTNGDVHIDYELNQSTAPNAVCPSMPKRTNGDLLFAYDFGGTKTDKPAMRVFRWAFAAGSTAKGTFTQLPVSATQYEADVNENNEMGFPLGKFGEFTFKLTDSSIGNISCGQFGATHLKSRASTEISAALKDRTEAQNFDGPCPKSQLDKQVRNVSDGQSSFSETTTADPGETLEYRLRYTNAGQGSANNVTLTDTIQPRSTFQSCNVAPTGSGSCSKTGTAPGSTVTWLFGTVTGGATRDGLLRVVLDSTFPAGSTLVKNTASADTKEEDPIKDSSTVNVGAAPKFTVEKKAGQSTSTVGGTVPYAIKITNVGNADGATKAVDDFDQAHVTVSNISDGGTSDGNKITWSSIAVPAGQSRTLTYNATYNGPFTSGGGTAGCSAGPPAQFPVNNTVEVTGATDSEQVCVAASPKFDVTKSADPASVNKGETAKYTIVVKNIGDAPGSTPVSDDYDQAHVTVSQISPAPTSHDASSGVITWSSGSLNPGQSAIFTYTGLFGGTPAGSGEEGCGPEQFPVVNVVTVVGDTARTIVCETPEPAFTVEKTATPTTAQVGQAVSYTVTVTNVSGALATTDVVDDYDEANLSVSGISDGGLDEGGKIRWASVTLPDGGSKVLTYTGTINGPFDGTPEPGCAGNNVYPVVNQVTVTGDSDTETVCVPASPALRITKLAVEPERTKITQNDLIRYTLAYSNIGQAHATNVVISDQIPVGTTFVSCTAGCVSTGNPITWNIGTVPAGTSGVVELVVKVADNPEQLNALGCRICNTGVISSAQGSQASSTACRDVVLDPQSDLVAAHGKAVAARVFVGEVQDDGTVKTIKDASILAVDSRVDDPDGGGQDGRAESAKPAEVTLLPGGDELLLSAAALRTLANSIATTQQASQTSIAEVQKLQLLTNVLQADGVIGTELLRAVATTVSNTQGGTASTLGSTLAAMTIKLDPDGPGGAAPLLNQTVSADQKNVVIPLDGSNLDQNNQAQRAIADALKAIFGAGSHLRLNGQQATNASAGQFANANATMLELHITNLQPLSLKIDLVVGYADANSKFPPYELCPGAEGVRARAYALEATAIGQPPARVAETRIPRVGGTSHQGVPFAVIGEDPVLGSAVATADNVVSHSTGVVTYGASNTSTANGYLTADRICLLRDGTLGTGCAVEAEVVRSDSTGQAKLGQSPTSTDGATKIARLTVRGIGPIPGISPSTALPRNELKVEIPNVGFLRINEQVHSCDSVGIAPTAVLASNSCTSGQEVRRTVTLLHLFITNPNIQLGGSPLVEVSAVHADSGAVFR